MALLLSPRFLSLSPNYSLSLRRTPPFNFYSSSAVRISMSISIAAENTKTGGTAVIWFKHDLRIDDHPGLVAASRHRTLIPLYVFDPRILSRFSDETLELLLFAVKDLKKSLRDRGSDLMIRFGSAENVIRDLVNEVNATQIFAEEEVEYELCRLMEIVKESLATISFEEGSPKFSLWTTPLYELKDLPASHHDFKKLNLPVLPPLLPPKLPDLNMDLAWGALPTLDDLEKFRNDNMRNLKDKWASIKKTSAEEILRKGQVVLPNNQIEGFVLSKSGESNSYKHAQRRKAGKSVFVTKQGNLVGGGTSVVLNALAAYLRYLEGTMRDDWQEVHEKLRNAEIREGASFGALFGPALWLGIISRRRVYYETIKYEKERNAGFLSPFGYSAAIVAASVDTVCSMEWYWLMASRCRLINDINHDIRIWRWNGYLIQYTVTGHEGSAIVLVHGFGAFWEHYRDNINSIAEGGNRVWAITLLGFGRSEKPTVVYTELMWAELLRDFIIDVVGEQVHLVGNSIGGYFIAIVAGLWPTLVKSVVLLNSAGNVIPEYSCVPSYEATREFFDVPGFIFLGGRLDAFRECERRISGAAWLGARLLLLYLRLSIRNIVKNCYTNNADRADDWLINEMTRASCDPGVVLVLESIFSFNLSIPLNYLLKGFEERLLVIQGINDPLRDSKSMVALLREHCKGIVIKELDAGHCPHDELPEKVNSIIREWVVTIERESFSVNVEQKK